MQVLRTLRNRMDDPTLLSPDVVINMLYAFRDVQVSYFSAGLLLLSNDYKTSFNLQNLQKSYSLAFHNVVYVFAFITVYIVVL